MSAKGVQKKLLRLTGVNSPAGSGALSFFSSLKTERLSCAVYKTREQADELGPHGMEGEGAAVRLGQRR